MLPDPENQFRGPVLEQHTDETTRWHEPVKVVA